jgi:hypothetical protein
VRNKHNIKDNKRNEIIIAVNVIVTQTRKKESGEGSAKKARERAIGFGRRASICTLNFISRVMALCVCVFSYFYIFGLSCLRLMAWNWTRDGKFWFG